MTFSQGIESTSPEPIHQPRVPMTDRQIAGKDLRTIVPRSAHAKWQPAADRPDPIALLEQSSQGRIQSLIPIRYGRMLRSPFAFLRGSASIMAADLATTPSTGLRVQACGDAHLLNFGGYATPERNLVFGLNDFDETLPAPWEWDVKRLATSIVVAGRDMKLSADDCREIAYAGIRSYRENMSRYAQKTVLEVWYSRIDISILLELTNGSRHHKHVQRHMEKARTRTSHSVFPKLTQVVDGERRIIDNPPLIYHLPPHDSLEAEVREVMEHYRHSVRDDLHVLLDRYRLADIAIKVVGVGSVGTRCAIALLMAGENDPLFLQIKEARPSVLEPYAGKSVYQNHGQRVVAGQRLMQAASDMFLGWAQSDQNYDFYIRQLRDMKISVDLDKLSRSTFLAYSQLCGWALSRAHARSGDAAMITGYIGKSDVFEKAIADFAVAYADQTEQDYQSFVDAVKWGRLPVLTEEILGR
ncbi:MAG: DUF2252 domain-containing protein [Cyanobacteria bacterium CRU_2_1]|nr:DUF2252 domain-containing protein [Cyanobacteria bacterium RU_5_0]NJR61273.1 DUF2252 domain-containing protein [Cyanobacteria bacterium CRU_2_1]